MTNPEYVQADWYPRFFDYPTDVPAVRSWAKFLMMLEAAVSLVVAVLVVARAVNILQ
jgi:hypothetical protein